MSTGKLTMTEFARATGRRVDEVKTLIKRGDLPSTPGKYIGRDHDMQPMFAPVIAESLVTKFVSRHAAQQAEAFDPRTKRDEVLRQAGEKRNQAVALEAGDSEAWRKHAQDRLDKITRDGRDCLRVMHGLPLEE